jgi:hypothetical protein
VDDLIIRRNGLSVNEIIKERLVVLPFKPLELSIWGLYYNIPREQIDLMPEFKD